MKKVIVVLIACSMLFATGCSMFVQPVQEVNWGKNRHISNCTTSKLLPTQDAVIAGAFYAGGVAQSIYAKNHTTEKNYLALTAFSSLVVGTLFVAYSQKGFYEVSQCKAYQKFKMNDSNF